MDDTKRRMNGKHRNKTEIVAQNIYADQEYGNVSKCIDIFWNEYRYFENKYNQLSYVHR